ncbi:MAG: anaerobic glycerol-3-phosphate dehydrogenase subunit C [Telmatospirillum sp.]|nr:anaerobic glycerol-3-phosphate dehydrogenase subunit C [Telmatospirillum sp.]
MRHDDVSLDNCLKCSDCNTVCPMLAANPAYPGPKHLGPELERLRREGLPCDSDWLEYCLGCHRCDLACPNQVNVSELIAAAKARHSKTGIRKFRDFWFARPALLGRMLSIVPALTNVLLGAKVARFGMGKVMKITDKRRFPPYARPNLDLPKTTGGKAGKLVFFPGCAIRYNQPDLAAKVAQVLNRNGFDTEVRDAGCCGVPALANGDGVEARQRAAANVEELSRAVREGARIVTACPSCGHMLKAGMADLLSDDPALEGKARDVARNTYDLAELLMSRSDDGALDTAFARRDMKLAYHSPCHQLSQGIGRPWFHLLRQVPGIAIEDLDAGCCGMSGTFGFKEEKYPASMAVGQRLFDRVAETRPEMVVTECATCRMQIEHGTGVRAIHPVEILLEAYGQRGNGDRHG